MSRAKPVVISAIYRGRPIFPLYLSLSSLEPGTPMHLYQMFIKSHFLVQVVIHSLECCCSSSCNRRYMSLLWVFELYPQDLVVHVEYLV